jgi:hypothetical protein
MRLLAFLLLAARDLGPSAIVRIERHRHCQRL